MSMKLSIKFDYVVFHFFRCEYSINFLIGAENVSIIFIVRHKKKIKVSLK